MLRHTLFATAILTALPMATLAGEAVSGADIPGLVGGKTIQGKMFDSGAYAEFYDADGTIKADGYTGKWSVKDNQMCFQYGSDPANCFTIKKTGDDVSWIADGKPVGDGQIVDGNPNRF
ncbi:hypothetical protein [Coralliovum pocilloporae]|uniref:hypothetical protein n=1 Tax=Coralliovum pocilloporae TaxID=3066369 RepID=UPI0033071CB2